MDLNLFLYQFPCSRFVLNVPKEDLQSFERILFLVEYAHWFYEDNSVEKNPSLKSFNLKEFTSLCILCSLLMLSESKFRFMFFICHHTKPKTFYSWISCRTCIISHNTLEVFFVHDIILFISFSLSYPLIHAYLFVIPLVLLHSLVHPYFP